MKKETKSLITEFLIALSVIGIVLAWIFASGLDN